METVSIPRTNVCTWTFILQFSIIHCWKLMEKITCSSIEKLCFSMKLQFDLCIHLLSSGFINESFLIFRCSLVTWSVDHLQHWCIWFFCSFFVCFWRFFFLWSPLAAESVSIVWSEVPDTQAYCDAGELLFIVPLCHLKCAHACTLEVELQQTLRMSAGRPVWCAGLEKLAQLC